MDLQVPRLFSRSACGVLRGCMIGGVAGPCFSQGQINQRGFLPMGHIKYNARNAKPAIHRPIKSATKSQGSLPLPGKTRPWANSRIPAKIMPPAMTHHHAWRQATPPPPPFRSAMRAEVPKTANKPACKTTSRRQFIHQSCAPNSPPGMACKATTANPMQTAGKALRQRA